MNGFNTLRKHLHVMVLVMTLHVEVGKNLSCLYTCYISSCDALARVFFFWAQTNWKHRILRKHIQDICCRTWIQFFPERRGAQSAHLN
jgi:hypothetical protein